MVLDAETVERIRKGVREREALRDPERIWSSTSIAIEVQGLSFEATRPGDSGVVMPVDEGGPSPVAHFLTGAGS